MDNENLKELKEAFINLQKGLTLFEGFLDTVKRNVGDIKSRVDILVDGMQEAERGHKNRRRFLKI